MRKKFAIRAGVLPLIAICGLLEGGCWPAHPPSTYGTIHEYAQSGDVAGVQAILEKSPNQLNLAEDDGQTPLHLAAEHCHSNVVSLLLRKGAKINIQASDDETPLHLAAQEGCEEVVKLLLAKGADTSAKDKQGRTPLDRARQWKQTNIVSLLLQRSVNP
jgi:ankyrin repeat protein